MPRSAAVRGGCGLERRAALPRRVTPVVGGRQIAAESTTKIGRHTQSTVDDGHVEG